MGQQMDFKTIMSGGGMTSASASGSAVSARTIKAAAVDFSEAFRKLREEASKTPEEKARDGVLKKHGLSEDDYRRMPADDRKGLDSEIAQAVRRVAEQRRAGMSAQNAA
jgi:hypothetical protein